MQSLCNDVTLVIDAENVRAYASSDWCAQGADASCQVLRHDGDLPATLSRALAQRKQARLSLLNRVDVVVAHPWAQLFVLPWQAGLFSEAAWQAYARASFARQRPDGDWRFCIQAERHGRARLACAMSEDMTSIVRTCCKASGWRLIGLRDAMSSLLGRHGARARAPDACFIVAQRDVVTCLFRSEQDWQDLVMLPRMRSDVREWLLSACLLADLPVPANACVAGCDLPDMPAGFERLEGGLQQAVQQGALL